MKATNKSSVKSSTSSIESVLERGLNSVSTQVMSSETNGHMPPHVMIYARAGTGKTTTLISGLQYLRGISPRDARGNPLIPSAQQQAIWESIKQSDKGSSCCFVAFNASIAAELGKRVPQGCSAMTIHSMGNRAVLQSYPFLRGVKPDAYKVNILISLHLNKDVREIRKESNVILKATKDLVSKCKVNLNDFANMNTQEVNDILGKLVSTYDITLRDEQKKASFRGVVFELVPIILNLCKDPSLTGSIDYDDMIWLPVVHNLSVGRFDLLMVDESQDLNRCQQELVKRAGSRLIFCGDDKQAIYGFAGADAESMHRLEKELEHSDRGVQILKLTCTRRCGKAIVEAAKKLVPDFEAHESNLEGSVNKAKYIEDNEGKIREDNNTYLPLVRYGDMILSRTNAALITNCLKLIRRGMRANIQGRDIASNLITLIEDLKAFSINDLIEKVEKWARQQIERENSKENPSENLIINIQDKADCILTLTVNEQTVSGVCSKINSIFSDESNQGQVKLSSIHRAKGLEAERVFLLQPKRGTVPHPAAKTPMAVSQEHNLHYVAITRAIAELIIVEP